MKQGVEFEFTGREVLEGIPFDHLVQELEVRGEGLGMRVWVSSFRV